MKICFIWVERFRNLRNFSLNLDSSQTFHYEKDTHKISRTRLKALPANFFPAVINDVAAVVGQNGVGKSNVLELLCRILKGSKSANFDFLLIYENDKGMHCSYRFQKVGKPGSKVRMEYHDEVQSDSLSVIFYSNVYTDRECSLGAGVIDLSPDQSSRGRPHLDDRRTSEFQKQIWFINPDSGFSQTGIQPPTHVAINVLRGPLDPGPARFEHAPLKIFRKASSRIRERVRRIEPQRKFIVFLTLIFFSRVLLSTRHLLEEQGAGNEIFRDFENFIEKLDNVPLVEIASQLIEYLENFVGHVPPEMVHTGPYAGLKNVGLKNLSEKVKFLRRLDQNMLRLEFEQPEADFRNMSSVTFNLEFVPESREWLIELLERFQDMQLFSINWVGISSGQRAYLSLFSLIAHQLSKTNEKFVFLSIDEGDLYLHPMWQVEFFARLLDVLKRAYRGKVQLLLTSHSPFLLADLPRQNFTVLSTLAASELDESALQRETFGGNLYDLYAGPLFIDTLKTSLFAQQKLGEMAKKAIVRPMSERQRKELLEQTRLIGDDIVKSLIIRDLND
jgi:energy-coupling factor transporter ATP-binding protein EcfA2